jgi:hypothetical protein
MRAPIFTPIGKGLPLSILIREVYTGAHPTRGLFGGSGDVAVVSGVKNYEALQRQHASIEFRC